MNSGEQIIEPKSVKEKVGEMKLFICDCCGISYEMQNLPGHGGKCSECGAMIPENEEKFDKANRERIAFKIEKCKINIALLKTGYFFDIHYDKAVKCRSENEYKTRDKQLKNNEAYLKALIKCSSETGGN